MFLSCFAVQHPLLCGGAWGSLLVHLPYYFIEFYLCKSENFHNFATTKDKQSIIE